MNLIQLGYRANWTIKDYVEQIKTWEPGATVVRIKGTLPGGRAVKIRDLDVKPTRADLGHLLDPSERTWFLVEDSAGEFWTLNIDTKT